jgi:hypothetical protein
MPEVIGFWEDENGKETPIYGEKPEPIDPFPYTPEGRRYERMERELHLADAVNKGAGLLSRKAEVLRERRALRAKRSS